MAYATVKHKIHICLRVIVKFKKLFNILIEENE